MQEIETIFHLNKDEIQNETENMNILFTRYLYELSFVENSLELSLLDKNREESLFWVYEMYHSGFKIRAWQFTIELYTTHYLKKYNKFKPRLDKLYAEWNETGNDCLLGTVIGTLASWNIADNRQFIILYREDRYATKPVISQPHHYLKQVSNYAVRFNENVDLNILQEVRDAYLGQNWLYYCSKTPIWQERILSGNGIVDDEKKCVEFINDDALELFYDTWGFEPDEQPIEIHILHGII